ncbi:ATP-binding protein [Cyclobacterium marinum]|nr:ATP-binding protein [Cyclobacterium marinum]
MEKLNLKETIEDRHTRTATLIVIQLPVGSWFDIIGEGTIADAILDRLVHTSHRIEHKGGSLRKLMKFCPFVYLDKEDFQKPLQMAYKRFRLQSKLGIKGCRGFYIQPGTTLVGYSIRSSLSFPTDSSTGLFSLSFQHLLVTKTAPTSGFQPPLSQQLRYTYYHFFIHHVFDSLQVLYSTPTPSGIVTAN